jgi:hypothetical protein
MSDVPRLMSAEQMVGAWVLMTGARITDKQKETITNLLVECYESGYRIGKRAAQTEPREQTDQERYDGISVTGSGRRVTDGNPCDECGANLDVEGHHTYCNSYPGKAAPPEYSCQECGGKNGQHDHWCGLFDPMSACDCTVECKTGCPRWQDPHA